MAAGNPATPQVLKVLSNNAVLVRAPGGKQSGGPVDDVVMVGRGIGFNRKPGDFISPSSVEHQYLEFHPNNEQLLRSINAIDPAVSETITAAVDLAVDVLGELHPSVYIVLAEHISYAVQRVERGEQIRNSLVEEIRAAFPLEFHAAELVVRYLNSHLAGVDMPVDEAAFITLHLNAARLGVTVKQPLATANALAGLVHLVCHHLLVTTTTLDGHADRDLAVEISSITRRCAQAHFRTNSVHRMVERDLPQETSAAREVFCHTLNVTTLPQYAEGEVAFFAVFLHGWRQTVQPN